jgi:excisionase family DNA binding protein
MKQIGNETFYSPKEAARLLGIHHSTVYRLLIEQKLESIKPFGKRLIPASEIQGKYGVSLKGKHD